MYVCMYVCMYDTYVCMHIYVMYCESGRGCLSIPSLISLDIYTYIKSANFIRRSFAFGQEC